MPELSNVFIGCERQEASLLPDQISASRTMATRKLGCCDGTPSCMGGKTCGRRVSQRQGSLAQPER